MAKQHLIFDASDANTILDSDSVGAFVRAADGTLITKTTVGGKEGLDVNVINASIEVTATDLDIRALTQTDEVTVFQGTDPWIVSATDFDIRDLSAAQDSIASYLYDGAGNAITSTLVGADQALDVNVVGGVNVEVDLSHVDDSVRLGDGTNFFTSTTVGADIGLDVNLINASIEVTATDLDIRNLTQTDEITVFQGTDPWLVNDAALANTAVKAKQNSLDVADTAEDVVAVADVLAGRKYLFLYNEGNRQVYIGESGITAAQGYPIFPGSELQLRIGAAVDLEFVGASGISGANAALRTLQLS